MAMTFRDRARRYLRSRSTRFALCMGALMYVSYAAVHDAWMQPVLIATTAFIGLALPAYSRFSNRLEERVNFLTAAVTAGRLARFVAQLAFNAAVFLLFARTGVLPEAGLVGIGGALGAALLTTLASQGAQYLGLMLARRSIGDANRNVLAGLSANIVATALATTGLDLARDVFLLGGIGLGAVVFGSGLLSDLRARIYPRRGIGVFFGTFNPFHVTHLRIIEQALRERGLARIVIHPTIVPRFHVDALERGEIRVARVENGLLVYERTEKADANVDYFATGNRFYPPEVRRHLISLAIREAGLEDRVEVAYLPDLYRDRGFHGVIAEIRRRHPGQPIHGIHGSDVGGMLVRAILDDCGWIYPMAVPRRDGVSATAIRAGAQGMTSPSVTEALARLSSGQAPAFG